MSLGCNYSVSMHITSSETRCSENKFNTSFPPVENDAIWYSTTVFLFIIMILAIVGNLIVLAATWIERNLHQPSKYFIACLAVADLLVGILSCPFLLYKHINKRSVASIYLCRFFIWIDIAAESVSIYTLTFISFDRYLKISKPLKYYSLMTTSKSFVVVCVVWLIGTVWATFGLFPYAGKEVIYIDSIEGCRNDNVIFYTASSIFAFIVPIIITLVMYVRILSIAHKRRRMARNGDLGQTNEVKNQRATFYQDLKNIRMLAIVVGTFILCFAPFFTLNVINYHYPGFFGGNNWVYVSTIIQLLPPLNSVCNPIIYACLDEKYREAFKRLYKSIRCSLSSESLQS